MSERKAKNKRLLSNTPPPSSVHVGLFDCYDFSSPNEYSEKTLGLFAFLLRKSVGDVNFSNIFGEVIERIRSKQTIDFVTLLEAKRRTLPGIDASIEKCLMLNRWITYINENLENFKRLISEIQTDMEAQLTDNRLNQMINYPEDFRQRERDFHKRVDAQNVRHLFYYKLTESKASNLIYLQNRTTEHLSYLIDSKMRYDRHFRDTGLKELEKIFGTSFMVIAQPHSGVNPVLVCERREGREGPGTHVAKVSVIIVSLLHDFMQTHPNIIELDDIEVTLCPTKNPYQLDESTKLSWKTCGLQINPNERSRIVQYAELTGIVIKQTSSKNKAIHFAEDLHSFTFAITIRLTLNEHKISTIYKIPLQSLPFGIVAHTGHISYSLTKVILNDIQRFSQHQSIDVKIISEFVIRYFIHRTGVQPKPELQNYLRQELNKAKDEKKTCQSLEDIYMDFLVQFVNQVEFMAKHPILAMLYSEGLFLGPCDSAKVDQVMRRTANIDSAIISLRCNSIKVDYKSDGATKNSNKSMKAPPCFVRVDIYNARTNYFQNRTFESAPNLMVDIAKFVCTANEERANCIQILSNFNNIDNVRSYKSFTKYYDVRLHDFHRADSKYKPIIDLLLHIEEVSDNRSQNTNGSNLSLNNSQTNSPPTTMAINYLNVSNLTNGHMPVPAARSMMQNGFSPSNQQSHLTLSDQDVIDYVLSKPNLCVQILRQFHQMRLSVQQQQQAQLSVHAQYPPSMQYSPQQSQATSLAMSNQLAIGNLYQYSPDFSGNVIQGSPQQHPIQNQYISMSTNDLRLDQTPSESTNEDSHQFVDDLFPFENM